MTDSNRSARNERRIHHEIRKIFVQACALLAPAMKEGGSTQGMSTLAKMYVIQDRFPGLSGTEVHIVVSMVERLHSENRLHAVIESQASISRGGAQ